MPRTRAGGQIVRRGERSWLVRIFRGRDEKGRRHFLNRTIHGTKRDAQAFLNATRAAIDRGELVEPSRESLGGYLDWWLSAVLRHRVRRRTAEVYADYLARYVRPDLQLRRLCDLRPEHIQAVYAGLIDRGLSARTVRLAHAVFRNALQHAVRIGRLARNPADLVDLPRQKRREMQALAPDQARRFVEAASGDPVGLVFVLAIATGGRPSEYFALKWSDLEIDSGDAGRVTIQRSLVRFRGGGWAFDDTKTERSRRTIPLPPSLTRSLRTHRARQAERRLKIGATYQDHNLVFCNELGRPLDAHNLSPRHFKRLLMECGLPRSIRLYDLRHTAATLLIAEGVDARTVADRLGHSNVSLTLGTYTHVTSEMQERATVHLERILTGDR